MVNEEKRKKQLAERIISNVCSRLTVNLRFLDMAIGMMKNNAYDGTFETDGNEIRYNVDHILKAYRASPEAVTRGYLHTILHCIFRHFFVSPFVKQELWDLSCDIAVEGIINELDLKSLSSPKSLLTDGVIERMRKNINLFTAEKIYSYFAEEKLSANELAEMKELFSFDDHSIWYKIEDEAPEAAGSGGKMQLLAEKWRDISERIQADLETFSRGIGNEKGLLMQNLTVLNREKYDYSEFLKKFSVMGETMKINDDEFDYIFYTYGLKMYKNLPLIEPLEYKETKKIRDFAIIIDTSGSVQGELVQKFVNKTYNILKQKENFFTKINLHIIQCDAEVQEDVKITSQAEFDEYMKNMVLKGFGGTDFRPSFSYVDELIKSGEFTNLKGIIYFTDGCGIFPERKPNYHTAFIYIDDMYNNPNVPAWAVKLVLSSDEIKEEL